MLPGSNLTISEMTLQQLFLCQKKKIEKLAQVYLVKVQVSVGVYAW